MGSGARATGKVRGDERGALIRVHCRANRRGRELWYAGTKAANIMANMAVFRHSAVGRPVANQPRSYST